MKKAIYFLHFASLYLMSSAQRTEFMFGVSGGLNRIVLGAAPDVSKTGYSHDFYLSLTYKGPKSVFRFNPSIAFITNSYQVKASQNISVTFPQSAWRLTLQTGFAITKHFIFKAGFFMQAGMNNNKYRVFVTTREGPQYNSAAFDELYDNYSSCRLQTGAQLGLMLTVGTKERFGFELQLQQFASPVSETNYYLPQKFEQGEEKLLIARNAKPTVLMLGVSYRIISKKSPKLEPDSENMRF